MPFAHIYSSWVAYVVIYGVYVILKMSCHAYTPGLITYNVCDGVDLICVACRPGFRKRTCQPSWHRSMSPMLENISINK